MVDDGNGAQGTEGDEPVAIWQYIDGVEVDIVVAGVELRAAHRLQFRMPATPPVEHHLAVIHLLQIGHSTTGAIQEIALDVRSGDYPVGGREEVEVVAIEGRVIGQIAIETGEGMDGVDGIVMIVHQDAHAWHITRGGILAIFPVRGVIAIIGLAIEHVLLEIPTAQLLEGAVVIGRLEAVIQQITTIIDLHDEGLVDKREVEVARYLSRGATLNVLRGFGGIGVNEERAFALGCGVFASDLFIQGYTIVERYGRYAIIDRGIPDGYGFEILEVEHLELDRAELSAERAQVEGIGRRQVDLILLALDLEVHHGSLGTNGQIEGMVVAGLARDEQHG